MTNQELDRRGFLKLAGLTLTLLAFKKSRPIPPEDESIISKSVELIDRQEIRGILKPFNMPVMLIPLRRDYLYDTERQIRTVTLNDINLPFADIYTLKTRDRQGLRTTILPYITGEAVLPVAVLDSGKFLSDSLYMPTESYWNETPKDNVKGSYTYMAENETGPTKIYANKIWNILEGAAALTEYQVEMGPLVVPTAGEYSLIEILDLKRRNYKSGFTITGAEVRAGGVCALSTVFGRSLNQVRQGGEQKELTFSPSVVVTEGWSHPLTYAYFMPPGEEAILQGSGSKKLLDVAIDYGDIQHDFKWRTFLDSSQRNSQMDHLYLWIEAQTLPNGKAPIEDLEAPADARLIVNLSWRPNPPTDNQLVKLKQLQQDYWHYHKTGETSSLLDQNSQEIERQTKTHFATPSVAVKDVAEAVYPEGGNNFQEELKTDPYLSEIKTLADYLNDYVDQYTYDEFWSRKAPGAGEYLRNTDWYRHLGTRAAQIEPALRHLDQNSFLIKAGARTKDQPIQCIGWTILLAFLEYDRSPKNIGGANVQTASQLVPKEIINGTYNYFSRHGYVFRVVRSFDEVDPGDQYVLYNGAGHIGVVVDKKQVDGQTILLVADANRHSDGKVHIFEVTDGNFDAVFGPGRKVVIK